MVLSRESADASVDKGLVIASARVPLTSVADRGKRLKSLVRRLTLKVNILEGDVDGAPFRTLVADDGSVMPYFGSVIYPGDFKALKEDTVSSLAAPRLASADVDLVVVGANQYLLPLYSQEAFCFIPKFVRVYMPIREHPDIMISHLPPSDRQDVRRSIRRMLEKGLEYEVVTKPSAFDSFYHEMYEPYAVNRHGGLARVHDYNYIKSFFTKGFILLIRIRDDPVAASVSYISGTTLTNTFLGIAKGDQKLLREGVSTALYYYSMQLAHSSGCTGIDFGNSRPFLSDGSLRYKLKWGMQVVDIDDGIGVYAIATPGQTEQAKRFLARNKFFHLTSKGIRLCEDF